MRKQESTASRKGSADFGIYQSKPAAPKQLPAVGDKLQVEDCTFRVIDVISEADSPVAFDLEQIAGEMPEPDDDGFLSLSRHEYENGSPIYGPGFSGSEEQIGVGEWSLITAMDEAENAILDFFHKHQLVAIQPTGLAGELGLSAERVREALEGLASGGHVEKLKRNPKAAASAERHFCYSHSRDETRARYTRESALDHALLQNRAYDNAS